MVSKRSAERTVGWIAGAAVVAVVTGVTGCSNNTSSSTEKKPTADSSATADAKKTDEGKKEAAQPAAARQSAEGAVAEWVTAIIKNQPTRACLVMADTDASPVRVGSASMCNSDQPDVRKMKESIGRLRESFTPKPAPSDPKVEVAQAPVTGDKAVVPANKVTIDGQTLDKVILSNSTGLTSGQLDVKVKASEINNAWYVTDFDLSVG
ncbi:hypothetical protein PS467_30920 [Streptomyces luomodiensis]|uniref:Lipoprotein n=1 Tax=Streptomyces luomodiensis TaxID=3026192 RepID=A0ABY9V3I4_9ACTN|nr:hypothetical protein [Streptomyces sp. SCA4-21]WNE99432.1 hypothetical protein PS467_30920 [Streptomyces sp. SCA4-21]